MQKIIAVILFLAFVGQSFSQGIFYLDYLVQKKAYMERCVNKARPKMHCDGKCQLMKKIEEQEKKERGQAPELKLAAKAEVLSSRNAFLLSLEVLPQKENRQFFAADSNVPVNYASAIFHPPSTIC
ncbi:hypothetical protein [Niabella beijingensis]|uniref:hypothetical protein n=1 Tax=Niabella beijingensis TaxID=2872700 RepID=UPI001CC1A257|nr:hypothetical protein [Niabella beijingensis]MBZ4192594.1 hypothetical protein [Niabella beijingensis]